MPQHFPPEYRANESSIFCVTTIHFRAPGYGSPSRPVGWFSDRAAAQRAILGNEGDIHETVYSYAVIDELKPGIYPECVRQDWFTWNDAAGRYEPGDEPKAEFEAIAKAQEAKVATEIGFVFG